MNRLALSLAVLSALVASPALAASPRWGSLELGAQTYRPDIDSEFPLPGPPAPPVERFFGTDRGWMFNFAVSRALFTKVGSLEAGVRTGYFRERGKGLISDGGTPPTFTESGDESVFNIIPTSLFLMYRVDDFADRWNVPLAPYVRATLERYNWWATDGNGTTERGATNGWSVTGGIGFLLDFLDPSLARELDADQGVNHTYLFFEVTRSSIDDFGSSSSWDLSDEDLSLGAGLLFVF